MKKLSNITEKKFNLKRKILLIIIIIFLFVFLGWWLYNYFQQISLIIYQEKNNSIILNKILDGELFLILKIWFQEKNRFPFLIISSLASLIIILLYYYKNQKNQKKIILFLILILIGGLLIRVFSFTGYVGRDDSYYAEIAHLISRGEFKIGDYIGAPVFPFRIGLTLPVALGFKIFGVNEISMVYYPFVLSLLNILIAFLAGCLFFSTGAGLIAATIKAILPMDVHLASILLPDLPAAFWANLGFLILYYGSFQARIKIKIISGILSGLFFLLSWLCKETILYFYPFIILYLAWALYRERKNIFLFISILIFASGLVIESTFYYHYTLNFFYRFSELERNYEVCKMWFFAEGTKFGWKEGEYWPAVLKRIFIEGPRLIFIYPNFWALNTISIFIIGYSFIKKLRIFLWPALWFLFLVLMFNFGSSSLQSYKPLVLFSRYLYPLILPALIIVAGFLDLNFSYYFKNLKKIKKINSEFFVCYIILVIIIFTCLISLSEIVKKTKISMGREIAQMALLKEKPYTDSTTAKALIFFGKCSSQNNIYDFVGLNGSVSPNKVYTLINQKNINF